MSEVPAVELVELRYRYPDGTVAVDGIDLCVAPGERVGIIGGNGAGKSTLLLHLNGVLSDRGAVRIFGVTVNRTTRQAIRQSVGLVFQNPEDQLFCPTVFDDVAFGPRNLRVPEDEVRRRVEQALSVVGLSGFKERSAFHLSLGQKKRAALATVLSMDARVLALDEPTSNVDPRARRELLALLRGLHQTQVIATHDLDFVRCACNRVVLLDQGRIAAVGTPPQILDNRELLEAHGL